MTNDSLKDLLNRAHFENVGRESCLNDGYIQRTAHFTSDKNLSFYLDQINSPKLYASNKELVEHLIFDPISVEKIFIDLKTLEDDVVIMGLRKFGDDKSALYTGPWQFKIDPNENGLYDWTVTQIAHPKRIESLLSDLICTTEETVTSPFDYNLLEERPSLPDWTLMVKKALERLQAKNDELSKVVLARKKTFQLAKTPSPSSFFKKMSKNARGVYKVLIDKGETFLSFSPESLHTLRDNILQLEAIAGTRPRLTENTNSAKEENVRIGKELLEDPKELDEHQRVIDLLVEKGNQFGLVRIGETSLLTLARLFHLRTPIEIELHSKELNLSEILNILDSLQPTPAVCGTPTKSAFNFIVENEAERDLYSGLLTVFSTSTFNGKRVDHSESTVLIRSLYLKDNIIEAYAGAGLVKDSVPEKEWDETANKINSFMELLNTNLNDHLERHSYNKENSEACIEN